MHPDRTTARVHEMAREAATLAYTMGVELAAYHPSTIARFVEGDDRHPQWLPAPLEMMSRGYIECLMDLVLDEDYIEAYWQQLRELIAEAYYAAA